MSDALRVLIVGGYGVFGGRLVELLQNDARLTLLVAGRSLARAQEFCERRSTTAARLEPVCFDRSTSDASALAALQPTLVVDASGPFQAYGDDRYQLIEYCIACRVHYLDLADGSDFVAGVAAFDDAARRAGVYVLSGVSSFPVLTAAVVRWLSAGVAAVLSTRGGIAPSPYAGVGMNVIRAIASYAGQAVVRTRDGRQCSGHPFTESMRFVVAVPGRIPLRCTRFSLVDVPDLRALAQEWPQATDVWMGAGPAPAVLHGALTALAWAVRWRWLPSLSWLAPMIAWVTNHVRWGEHRGGMFVVVRGRDGDGGEIVREWHLLAEGDDGPLIPCMAVEAVVRRVLASQPPAPGARTAIRDVELADYEALFASRTIFTATRQRCSTTAQPLYRQRLGQAWQQLPLPLQQLHTVDAVGSTFAGYCSVERGRSPLAWIVAKSIGFPRAGDELPVSVRLVAEGDSERWSRRIGGSAFSSVQSAGRGRADGLVRERFGAVAVDMALVVEPGRLVYVVRRWSLFGVPLPIWLGPRSVAVETADEQKFCFDVRIAHPLTGLIVRYRGWLLPALR
jgi:Domain of unknown function (DUF4166)/Saccharopine dehydrogenase NADP binding domain